jgi:hypothetical protein
VLLLERRPTIRRWLGVGVREWLRLGSGIDGVVTGGRGLAREDVLVELERVEGLEGDEGGRRGVKLAQPRREGGAALLQCRCRLLEVLHGIEEVAGE